MILFWDTSAVLAVVLQEKHSTAACRANRAATRSYAWTWLRVEAESALARRRATVSQWKNLEAELDALQYVDLPAQKLDGIRALNRTWRLRAADAGHLYCFLQASKVIPEIQLVCFDDEILKVARRLNLPVWSPDAGNLPPGRVRESKATYASRRRPKRERA